MRPAERMKIHLPVQTRPSTDELFLRNMSTGRACFGMVRKHSLRIIDLGNGYIHDPKQISSGKYLLFIQEFALLRNGLKSSPEDENFEELESL